MNNIEIEYVNEIINVSYIQWNGNNINDVRTFVKECFENAFVIDNMSDNNIIYIQCISNKTFKVYKNNYIIHSKSDDFLIFEQKTFELMFSEPKKYTKLNNEYEAIQWAGLNLESISKFMGISKDNMLVLNGSEDLKIQTENGILDVYIGDYIVKENEVFYPYDKNTFHRQFKLIK